MTEVVDYRYEPIEYPDEAYFEAERARLDEKEKRITAVIGALEDMDCRHLGISPAGVSLQLKFWQNQMDCCDLEKDLLESDYAHLPCKRAEDLRDYAFDLAKERVK